MDKENLKYLESTRRFNESVRNQSIAEAVNAEEEFGYKVECLRNSLEDSLDCLIEGISDSSIYAYWRYSSNPEELAVALDTLLNLEERALNYSLSNCIGEEIGFIAKYYSELFGKKPEETDSELVKDLDKGKEVTYDGSGSFEEIRERMWNVIVGLCLNDQIAYIQKWIKYNALFGAENPYTPENYWKALTSEEVKSSNHQKD